MSATTVNGMLPVDRIQLNQSQSSISKNSIIVWLDTSPVFPTDSIQKHIIELRRIFYIVETFNDVDACVDYTTNIEENRICFIINETDAQLTVFIIHDFEQIDSIFILRMNTMNDEQWPMQYNKVKGIFNDITSIQKYLEEILYEKYDPIGFEITNSSTTSLQIDGNKKNKQEVMFMYGQLIKEILTELPYSTNDMNYMIEFCLTRYIEDEQMVKKIVQFECQYRSQAAVHWYTKNEFPYGMINTALRTHDLSTLYAMRRFIQDVHKQIVQLYANSRKTSSLSLYRGQPMPIEDFERIKSNLGGLLSINSFWSTTADETVARFYTGDYGGMISVVFVINIDPFVQTTAFFANVENESQFGDHEKEYLFTMGSVFRIVSIEEPDKTNMWTINLKLTSDNDPQLTLLTHSIRSAIKRGSESHICGFVILMMYMNEYELAAQMLETIVERETNALECMKMHWTLGMLYINLSKNQQALINYDLVVKSPALRFLPTRILAYLFHSLGELCTELKKLNLALINMEIALYVEILYVPHHDDAHLARYCRDIARIYEMKGNIKDALPFYQIAYEKTVKSYPPQHPIVTKCALDLFRIFADNGQEKYAESILRCHVPNIAHSFPPNHPMQVRFHVYTGYTCLEQGDFSGAHDHFQSALAIDHNHIREDQPVKFAIYWAIATAFGREGRYNEAYNALTTALHIQIDTLPPEHLSIAMTYTEMGKASEFLYDFPHALSHYESAMKIFRQHMSPTHPTISQIQQHIIRLYKKLGRYYTPQSS